MYEENVVAYFHHHLSGQPPFDRWIYNTRRMGRRNNPWIFGYVFRNDKLNKNYFAPRGIMPSGWLEDSMIFKGEEGMPWKKK